MLRPGGAHVGQPFVQACLAEVDGVPAGAGLAGPTGRHVGHADIATLHDHRRQGVGPAVPQAILRDGRTTGAYTAHPHSSQEALPLFEQAGLRTRWAGR
ncbi:GNAT family N-acetyltransferase [Streptomyces spinosus]|uniref:GNAT family N-acetyltransferase n=1 Tax=Streptomyces spinosus TaxID=2872623 RepID=UPI001CED306A|nr:GNAT family N-acetyltransferase [Streptomyces spinosus]